MPTLVARPLHLFIFISYDFLGCFRRFSCSKHAVAECCFPVMPWYCFYCVGWLLPIRVWECNLQLASCRWVDRRVAIKMSQTDWNTGYQILKILKMSSLSFTSKGLWRFPHLQCSHAIVMVCMQVSTCKTGTKWQSVVETQLSFTKQVDYWAHTFCNMHTEHSTSTYLKFGKTRRQSVHTEHEEAETACACAKINTPETAHVQLQWYADMLQTSLHLPQNVIVWTY